LQSEDSGKVMANQVPKAHPGVIFLHGRILP